MASVGELKGAYARDVPEQELVCTDVQVFNISVGQYKSIGK